MKRSTFTLLGLFLLLSGCIKDKIKTADLLSPLSFSARQVPADGTTIVTITSVVNANADSARRSVVFTASSGSFVGGTDSTFTTTAIFQNQQLVAHAQFKAPLSPGSIVIKARMNLLNEKKDYTQIDSIKAVASVPAKISLSASSFAVKVNFGSEVTITGLLSNAQANMVSLGNAVVFADRYADHSPVNGSYRQAQLTSNALSSVSVIYSPGNVPVGKGIWLSCYLVNQPTVRDSVFINTISN